ncbi:hypothetical protein F2P45_09335 [Massilia sp. CCM 8733]|uniref:Uncharacterized protein n=1 Tax=Massilia mucilaginosa TaxID=2609282 RepID=A0ABX0NR46_9BURK|nr:hypothetical protein [Massilia mucilaginosa]NHZ89218.1 hypothetical protein [Massilia mucilaginosa]
MAKSAASLEFLDGCIIEKDYFFFSTRLDIQPLDEYDHGRIMWFESGRWFYQDRNWQVSAVCVLANTVSKEDRAYVTLEEGSGVVGFYIPGRKKDVIDEDLPGGEHGHGIASLTDISQVGGNLYLCGYGGRVMRRVDGKWEPFDKGLKALTFGDFLQRGMTVPDALQAAAPTQRDLTAINGFSEDDIYCVGREGLIFHFDGQIWFQIEKPTNVDLNCVHCAEDGFVYAAGNRGVLVQGKGNNFHALATGVHDDFYAATWFDDHLYVGGLKGLYRLEKDGLRYVDTGEGSFKCRALDSCAGQMLVVAKRWLAVFDGLNWKRIDHPDNI